MSLLDGRSLVIVIADVCTRLPLQTNAGSTAGVYWQHTAMRNIGQGNGLALFWLSRLYIEFWDG